MPESGIAMDPNGLPLFQGSAGKMQPAGGGGTPNAVTDVRFNSDTCWLEVLIPSAGWVSKVEFKRFDPDP